MHFRKFLLALFLVCLCVLPRVAHGGVIIQGGGASFPSVLYKRWMEVFINNYTTWLSGINYAPSSSSSGVKQLLSNGVNFAGSDIAPVTNDKQVVFFPAVAGAIAVAYRIPEFAGPLTLTRQNVADIFAGRVLFWNDPSLQVRNPTLAAALGGAQQRIQLVVRQPGSGTTANFLSALHSFDPNFPGPVDAQLDWKKQLGTNSSVFVATTNGAVGILVSSIPFSISYMDLTEVSDDKANGGHADVANIVNVHGDTVAPNMGSIQAAMTVSKDVGNLNLIDSPVPGAYPITVYTNYVLRNNSLGNDTDTARWTLRYLHWTLTQGNAIAAANNFVPLTRELTAYSLSQLKSLIHSNQVLYGQSFCDFEPGKPGGCQHGRCFLDLPFQPPTAQCICDDGYVNLDHSDCSESARVYKISTKDIFGLASFGFMFVGLLIVGAIFFMMWWYRDRPQIKAISPPCCYILLVGCMVGLLGIVPYAGLPTYVTCRVRPFFPAAAFATTFGMMLMKLWRIYLIFQHKRNHIKLGYRKSVIRIYVARNSHLILATVVIILVELMIVAAWISATSPHVNTTLNDPESGTVHSECAVHPSKEVVDNAFTSGLYVLNGAILVLCVYFAYKTRTAYKRFRESQTMGFCVYMMSVLMAFGLPVVYAIPASTTTAQGIRKLITCVIIFSAAAGIPCVLYIPRLIEAHNPESEVDSINLGDSSSQAIISHSPSSQPSKDLPSSRESAIPSSTCMEVVLRQDYMGAQWQTAIACIFANMDLLIFLEKENNANVILSFRISDVRHEVLQTSSPPNTTSLRNSASPKIMIYQNSEKWTACMIQFPSVEAMRLFLSVLNPAPASPTTIAAGMGFGRGSFAGYPHV